MKKGLFCAGLFFLSIILISCPRKNIALQPSDMTVRLLTHAAGIDDRSFNAAAWQGILEFFGDTWDNTTLRGTAYDLIIAQVPDMYVPVIMQAADEGYDLIAATGFLWGRALDEAASVSPNQNFLIVDIGGLTSPNIMQAVYAEHEGSYLVGAAAALKALEDGAANPRFGFIGGMQSAVITKFQVGYVQGILSIIPDAQIVDYYVNNWNDPALAKTQARNWYDSGVYAIFSAAGNSGNGAIAQAKEYRAVGRNVWAIGVDSDQHEEGIYNDAGDSAVLTSMLKRVDLSLMYALNAIKYNRFEGKVVTFDTASGGVDYSASNPVLSEEIILQLDDIKNKIANGQIIVASTLAQALEIPGFPQHLRAIDD